MFWVATVRPVTGAIKLGGSKMPRSVSARRLRLTILAGAAVVGVIAALPAAAGANSARLILESSAVPAMPGSASYATARLGPCGTIKASGTLTNNDRPKDTSAFIESQSTGGGCGEAGPSFSGRLDGARVDAEGTISLLGEMTYIPGLSFCTYRVKKLEGTFSLPGLTEATVSGTGTRVGSSKTGCAKHTRLDGVEAKLGPTEDSTFEAALD